MISYCGKQIKTMPTGSLVYRLISQEVLENETSTSNGFKLRGRHSAKSNSHLETILIYYHSKIGYVPVGQISDGRYTECTPFDVEHLIPNHLSNPKTE